LNGRLRYRRFPAGNPVANALLAVVGTLAVGAAIVFGFFVFLFLAGLVLALVCIVGVRIWWVGRRLRKLNKTALKTRATGPGGQDIIEGEYHDVTSRRNERD
jgi:hypothetical protein